MIDIVSSYLFGRKSASIKFIKGNSDNDSEGSGNDDDDDDDDYREYVNKKYKYRKIDDDWKKWEDIQAMFDEGWFGELQISDSSPYYDCGLYQNIFCIHYPLPKELTADKLIKWLRNLDSKPLEDIEMFYGFELGEPKLLCYPDVH